MKKHFYTFESPVRDQKPSIKLNSNSNGEEIKPISPIYREGIMSGTLHGGEEIKPGTLHGGEEILPGTLHGGEEIKPGTLHGGEEIKPGTLHTNFTPATYRTKDGNAFYKFNYVDIGGKFEIDILEQPSYESRESSANKTHRLPSGRNGQKICISAGSEPTTLDAAKNISMQWAELTHNYIKTGKNIDDQVSENSNGNKKSNLFDWLFK